MNEKVLAFLKDKNLAKVEIDVSQAANYQEIEKEVRNSVCVMERTGVRKICSKESGHLLLSNTLFNPCKDEVGVPLELSPFRSSVKTIDSSILSDSFVSHDNRYVHVHRLSGMYFMVLEIMIEEAFGGWEASLWSLKDRPEVQRVDIPELGPRYHDDRDKAVDKINSALHDLVEGGADATNISVIAGLAPPKVKGGHRKPSNYGFLDAEWGIDIYPTPHMPKTEALVGDTKKSFILREACEKTLIMERKACTDEEDFVSMSFEIWGTGEIIDPSFFRILNTEC